MREPDDGRPWPPVESVDPNPGTPPPRHNRGRTIAAVLVVLALAGGGIVAVRELPRTESTQDAAPVPSQTPQARPSAGSGASPIPAQSESSRQRTAVAQALLDHRATAIMRRDAAAFAATIDSGAADFAGAQAAMFDSLRAVPYDHWAYELEALDPFTLPGWRRRTLGAPAFTAQVSAAYRIEGYDSTAARFDVYLTFVQRDGRWLITSDSDGDDAGQRTQRQLWDFGSVTVVRGARSIVLGLGERSTMERHASDADAAVPRVTKVWGEDWEQKVVVIAPDTQEHMAAILGADEDRYRQIAAITRAESAAPNDSGVADRVVINPAIWRRLESYGRRIVMTHEVTHVATRVSNTEGMPTWLSEGFADYVGYLGTGIEPTTAAPELLDAVRADGAPDALPSDEDFRPDNSALAAAYQKAWLACRLIVDEHGEDALVELYRNVGAGTGTKPANLEAAFRAVLGTTAADFTAAWSSYIAGLAQ